MHQEVSVEEFYWKHLRDLINKGERPSEDLLEEFYYLVDNLVGLLMNLDYKGRTPHNDFLRICYETTVEIMVKLVGGKIWQDCVTWKPYIATVLRRTHARIVSEGYVKRGVTNIVVCLSDISMLSEHEDRFPSKYMSPDKSYDYNQRVRDSIGSLIEDLKRSKINKHLAKLGYLSFMYDLSLDLFSLSRSCFKQVILARGYFTHHLGVLSFNES